MTGIYIGKKELKLHHQLSFFTRTEANATHLVPHIFIGQIPRRAASRSYATTLIYITFM